MSILLQYSRYFHSPLPVAGMENVQPNDFYQFYLKLQCNGFDPTSNTISACFVYANLYVIAYEFTKVSCTGLQGSSKKWAPGLSDS